MNGGLPRSRWRLAALLGTLILVGVALNATIVIADSNLRQPAFDRRACSVIPESLAC